jgi:CheY-like chemotaxis protein
MESEWGYTIFIHSKRLTGLLEQERMNDISRNKSQFNPLSIPPEVFIPASRAFIEECHAFCNMDRQNHAPLPQNIGVKIVSALRLNAKILGQKNLQVLFSEFENSYNNNSIEVARETLMRQLKDGLHQQEKEFKAYCDENSPRMSDDTDENVLPGCRVLVAEDLPTNALIVSKFLERAGASVSIAKNGQEAIDTYQNEGPFDIVLMDLTMPVMDGFTATKKLRSMNIQTPIIAVTALAMREDRVMSEEAGCDAHIAKPINRDELLSVCQKYYSIEAPTKNSTPSNVTKSYQRILLATDNRTQAAFLQAFFQHDGYEVDIVNNADQAIQSCLTEDTNYSAVFVEEDLSQKDWRSFLQMFQKANMPLNLIVITDDDVSKVKEIILSGAFAYLDRTITIEGVRQISGMLKEHIEAKQKEKESFVQSFVAKPLQDTLSSKDLDNMYYWQKAIRGEGGDRAVATLFNLHGKTGILIADVAGHDKEAARIGNWLSGLVKGTWHLHQDPVDFLNSLNSHVQAQDSESRFVCTLVLVHDPLRQTLYYANAGIPAGYLVDTEAPQKSQWLHWTGTPIGMFSEEISFESGQISFTDKHRLFVTTDAVFESLPENVIAIISEKQANKDLGKSVEAIADYFLRSVEVVDDITILGLDGQGQQLTKPDFRFSCQSTFEEIDRAMTDVDIYLNDYHSERLDVDQVSGAIREALLNAAEHGNSRIADKWIDIDLFAAKDHLSATISDEGPGFSIVQKIKQKASPEADTIQSRGLEIVTSFSSSATTEGSSLKLSFNYTGDQ